MGNLMMEFREEMKRLETEYLLNELTERRLRAIQFSLEDKGILEPKFLQLPQ
ncbi:MAG: hypothetical protein V1869_06325 [Candidatus Omnitrophota bacterium]